MGSYILAIESSLYNLGIIKGVRLIRNSNKIVIPSFVPSEEPELLNLGKTQRQFNIDARYVGSELQIKTFIDAIDDADYYDDSGIGNSKQCYIFLRTDILGSGTATSTSSGKLIDSSATFTTWGITASMYAYNITDNTSTLISSVDSQTQLTLGAHSFTSGESYVIYGHATPCFVMNFEVDDSSGKPGFIDYNIILQEGTLVL